MLPWGVCYLFENLAARLGLILLAEHFSGAEAMPGAKAFHSMVEQLIQRVFPSKVHLGETVELVDRAVRALWAARGGLGLDALGQSFLLLGPGDEVPGKEGEQGVEPHQQVDGQENHRLEVEFHTHPGVRLSGSVGEREECGGGGGDCGA